jgi:hypothetical protein
VTRAIVLGLFLFAGTLFASPKPLKATQLFVPLGYDNNDVIVVVVEGYLENTCQQVRSASVAQSQFEFEVTPLAETLDTRCEPLVTAYTVEVVLNPKGPIDRGNYLVTAPGPNGVRLKEPLPVGEATEVGIDNARYAPVDSLEVGMVSGGKMRAVLEGRFQNTCLSLEMGLTSSNGKTFELVPIVVPLKADRFGKPCADKEWRYRAHKDFDEPTLPGRYLLHVRSQNGKSLNRVFSNIW